ncbi:hypothetical protein TrST_g10080 [Triparma strigata]|uniref:Uncharacterized protein n=1 Tax=Triparma strigata TaxID=1606541 RepID=A0A9W7AQN7_9STRA|nr:hypothetical protein TrST_g10080 [Triparma strigata]
MKLALFTLALFSPAVEAILPPTLPSWEPTYDMSLSTLTMQCNGSGWSDPTRGAEFGVVSYDWSNAKSQWAMSQPMDCEERLIQQASMTKAANPNTHSWVYRNVVKALPWFTSVREILDDPAYSGFFLKFDPDVDAAVPRCAPENQTKCSIFYHDQMQTPAVPTPDNPNPDGSCPETGCNSGLNPTGEYLFDHRNSSLLPWLLEKHILSETAIGHPDVDGMFMDDYWCSNLVCSSVPTTPGCPCSDPVQGATEVDANQQKDMGLSDEDIRDLYYAWDANMQAIQQAIVDNGAYTWSLMAGQGNANAMPDLLTKNNCATKLRAACSSTSEWQTESKLFGLTVEDNEPSQLEEDVAFFLLARGDYAWLGWGTWGMTWPFNPSPAHGELPPLPNGVPRPEMIDRDFGKPVDTDGFCQEDQDGVFTREWTSGTVELDCNNFVGSVPTVAGGMRG